MEKNESDIVWKSRNKGIEQLLQIGFKSSVNKPVWNERTMKCTTGVCLCVCEACTEYEVGLHFYCILKKTKIETRVDHSKGI